MLEQYGVSHTSEAVSPLSSVDLDTQVTCVQINKWDAGGSGLVQINRFKLTKCGKGQSPVRELPV